METITSNNNHTTDDDIFDFREKAEKFDAETHVAFFKKIFKRLGVKEVKCFALAQVSDSTNLNPKIARLLGIPHVACRCHTLALAGSLMEDFSAELRYIIETIHEDHSLVKRKNKLSASLSNVQETSYSLKTKAKPRWGTVPELLTNHVKSEADLRKVATKSNGELSDRSISAVFMAKVGNHTSYLADYGKLVGFLQIEHLLLTDANVGCNEFASQVRSGHGVPGHPYEHCKMGQNVAKILVGNKYDSR